ncbi:MAG TPA: ATP-dependent DNA ligase [Polyangiales bacterium]
MLLEDLARLSATIASTSKRNLKIAHVAQCLRDAEPAERGLVALYLSGATRQGRLSVGYKQIQSALEALAPEGANDLTLSELDAQLEALQTLEGKGVNARRAALLRGLFERCHEQARRFVAALLVGELRQGALESLVLDAIAQAAGADKAAVRRAQMLRADLREVCELAFSAGDAGLTAVRLKLFQPVQPMLAEPVTDIGAALETLREPTFELKMDGARVQVHKQGEEVRVYSRALNEVSGSVPEVLELVRALAVEDVVLDGEVIVLHADGTPVPFQQTMRRFGRKLDVEALRRELPLSTFFFDCLHAGGETLLDAPLSERAARLAALLPEGARMPRLVGGDAAAVQAFYEQALDRGHEGLMAKELGSPYMAGSRGSSWLKLKQAHTLDLVVLAAEWGSGRRTGSLSNLHLGARDPEQGGFVMLGKTFKGLTDELLRFQTRELLARETSRDAYTVHVRPELVVEVAFNDVQTSPQYPGGVALRFARVKRYRPDKTAAEADTLAQVRAFVRPGTANAP